MLRKTRDGRWAFVCEATLRNTQSIPVWMRAGLPNHTQRRKGERCFGYATTVVWRGDVPYPVCSVHLRHDDPAKDFLGQADLFARPPEELALLSALARCCLEHPDCVEGGRVMGEACWVDPRRRAATSFHDVASGMTSEITLNCSCPPWYDIHGYQGIQVSPSCQIHGTLSEATQREIARRVRDEPTGDF